MQIVIKFVIGNLIYFTIKLMNDQLNLSQLERTLEDKISEINSIKSMLLAEIQSLNSNSKCKKGLISNASKLIQSVGSIREVLHIFRNTMFNFSVEFGERTGAFVVRIREMIAKQHNIYVGQLEKFKRDLDQKQNQNINLQRRIQQMELKMENYNLLKETSYSNTFIDNLCSQEQILSYPADFKLNTICEEDGQTFTITLDDKQAARSQFKIREQNKTILKTEPDEDIHRSGVSERSISCRKLDAKHRIRSYIDNFRNIIEVTTKGSKPFQEIMLENTNHIADSKLTTDSKITTPEMTTPVKLPKKKFSFQQNSNSSTESHIVELGSGLRRSIHRHSIGRKDSKQKIQVTQKEKVKSELAAKDCNIIIPRPPSKEKIKMTLKNSDVKQSVLNQSKLSRTSSDVKQQKNNSSTFLQEQLEIIDIYLGDRKTQQHYEGAKKDYARWGRGRLEYVNGLIYEGDFKDNMRHGHGVLTLNGKKIYEGEWQRDRICGKGVLSHIQLINKRKLHDLSILRDAVYEGYFDNNKFQGCGLLILSNGDRVEGQFNSGLLRGQYQYISEASGRKKLTVL